MAENYLICTNQPVGRNRRRGWQPLRPVVELSQAALSYFSSRFDIWMGVNEVQLQLWSGRGAATTDYLVGHWEVPLLQSLIQLNYARPKSELERPSSAAPIWSCTAPWPEEDITKTDARLWPTWLVDKTGMPLLTLPELLRRLRAGETAEHMHGAGIVCAQRDVRSSAILDRLAVHGLCVSVDPYSATFERWNIFLPSVLQYAPRLASRRLSQRQAYHFNRSMASDEA